MIAVQYLINGIMLGGIYALLGVGMTMIFGIVKLTNLAHGEFVILGAYGSTVLAQALGLDPLITLIITVPLMFLIGMGLQYGLINRVMQKGSEPALLVTFGLQIILQSVMLMVFSADPYHSGAVYSGIYLRLGELSIALLDIILLAISVVAIIVLSIFLNKTYLGKAIRATSDDTSAAALMGVSVKKTYAIALGIAMATAAVAGACIGLKYNYYPSSGGSYLLIAFAVVVIGGMGSIKGTLIGGLIFGLVQVIGGPQWGMLASYVVLIIMLVVRPQGIFSK